MKDKILHSLSKLDVANDDHWTTDGLPRLDIVNEIVGEAVTRADISEHAGAFTRKNSVIVEADVEADVGVNKDLSNEELCEQELCEARKYMGEAQERLRKANASMDVIIRKREDEAAGRTTANDIKAYQKSEQLKRIKSIR